MNTIDWDEFCGRLVWSLLVGVAAAFLLLPMFASIAQGQPVDVEPEAVALDLAGLALTATVLALATEWLRSLVPAWQRGAKADPSALMAVDAARSLGLAADHLETLRKLAVATGGMGELAKSGLRVVPVVLGIAAAFLEWAPAIGDGSAPRVFGGVGAGLIASLFGGSLVSAVRDRLPGSRKRLATMDTGTFRAHRADEQAGE